MSDYISMEQLIVSCRKAPGCTTKHCGGPLEVYDMHGQRVTMADMWRRLAHKNVCVNVHGYRSPWQSVLTASNEILMGHKSVDSKYDACVMFAWPGSWAIASGYILSTWRTRESGLRFQLFLEQLMPLAASVDIQTHSLGARVALNALKNAGPLGIGTLALCAPAVDATALWDEFAVVTRNVRRVKVFYSGNDSVLANAYRKVPWNWFSPALGLVGPMPPGEDHPLWDKIQAYDYTGIALGHSAYRDLPKFYMDLNA